MVKGKLLILLFVIGLIPFVSSWDFSSEGVSSSPSSVSVTTLTGNLTTFLELSDTPNAYTGDGGNCVKVNVGESALEFGSCGSITETDPKWTANITNYFTKAQWNVTNTSYLRTDQWNSTNTSYYGIWNPYGYYNITTIGNLPNTNNYWNNTYATFNKTYADTLYFGIGNWNATNTSYALNQTLTDMWSLFLAGGTETDPKWTANITNYFTKAQWNVTNTSYLRTDQWNSTNTSYLVKAGDTMTGNLTIGNNFITNGTGGAYIYHNGTGWVIKG